MARDPKGFAEVAAIIEKEGVGYIALSDANYESMDNNVTSTSGAILEHGEPQAFRAAMPEVPLLLSSTYDPQQCADAITAGFADGIMLARQMLADPEFPNKVLQGRQDEIVWCDHDNSCLRRLIFNVPVRCHKNPAMGREAVLAGAKEPVSVKLQASGPGPTDRRDRVTGPHGHRRQTGDRRLEGIQELTPAPRAAPTRDGSRRGNLGTNTCVPGLRLGARAHTYVLPPHIGSCFKKPQSAGRSALPVPR